MSDLEKQLGAPIKSSCFFLDRFQHGANLVASPVSFSVDELSGSARVVCRSGYGGQACGSPTAWAFWTAKVAGSPDAGGRKLPPKYRGAASTAVDARGGDRSGRRNGSESRSEARAERPDSIAGWQPLPRADASFYGSPAHAHLFPGTRVAEPFQNLTFTGQTIF